MLFPNLMYYVYIPCGNNNNDDDAEYWLGEACVSFVASCQGQKQASELGPFGKCMLALCVYIYHVRGDVSVVV